MRTKGSDNQCSKKYIAIHKDSGASVIIHGLRSFCGAMWGYTPAGIPRYISSALELVSGESKRGDLFGWTFSRYVEEVEVDPIGEALDRLGY